MRPCCACIVSLPCSSAGCSGHTKAQSVMSISIITSMSSRSDSTVVPLEVAGNCLTVLCSKRRSSTWCHANGSSAELIIANHKKLGLHERSGYPPFQKIGIEHVLTEMVRVGSFSQNSDLRSFRLAYTNESPSRLTPDIPVCTHLQVDYAPLLLGSPVRRQRKKQTRQSSRLLARSFLATMPPLSWLIVEDFLRSRPPTPIVAPAAYGVRFIATPGVGRAKRLVLVNGGATADSLKATRRP